MPKRDAAMPQGCARALHEWVARMDLNDPRLSGDLTAERKKELKEGARQTLVMLLGFDLGEDPQAWRKWINEHEDELGKYVDLSSHDDDDKYSL